MHAGSTSDVGAVDTRIPFRHRAWIFALIAGIFGLLQIHQSLDQGRLAFPITYDDTTYFWEGLSRLHAIFDRGVPAFFADWWSSPPHSPWSTLMAFAGFGLFGPHDWSPAAMNAGVLMLMAVALAAVVRRLRLLVGLSILVAVLTWPYFGHLVLDARPDMAWGMSAAAFTALVATAATEPWSRRRIGIAAALLVLVLLTKVTTLPVSLAIVGTVCLTTLVVRWRRSRDTFRQHAVALAAIVTIAALVALPHYAISIGGIYNYVVENVFGNQARVWEVEVGGASGHALYHLTGPGGQTMMREWLWLWLLTFVLFAANVVRTRDSVMLLRSGCFAAAFVVAFVGVSVPAHKSPHIGAVVPAHFLISWVLMNVYLVARDRPLSTRRIAVAALVLALAIGIWIFAWQSTVRYGPPSADRVGEIAKRRQDVASVFAAFDRAAFDAGDIFVGGATLYLNADLLRYYAIRQRRDHLRFADSLFSDDPAKVAARIDSSDGVLLFTPDNPEVFRSLPGNRPEVLAEAARYVSRDPNLKPVLALVSHAGPGAAQLYLRKPAFQIGPETSGFGPFEGPYPQWNLPIVRWGLGPSSRFIIAEEGATRLMLRAQTSHPNQVMTVFVDGVQLVRHAFNHVDRSEDIVVELPPAPRPLRNVELQYSTWTPGTVSDPRKMAVLFRRIQWQ